MSESNIEGEIGHLPVTQRTEDQIWDDKYGGTNSIKETNDVKDPYDGELSYNIPLRTTFGRGWTYVHHLISQGFNLLPGKEWSLISPPARPGEAKDLTHAHIVKIQNPKTQEILYVEV